MQRSVALLLVGIAGAFLVVGSARAADPVAFFESRVRPLLVEHCQKCHGPEKQRGDLRLTSRAAILEGGSRGPAAVSGKPGESLLVKALRHSDDLAMPPDRKLAAADIDLLARWIEMGLPWPKEQAAAVAPTGWSPQRIAAARREHWAFRPMRDPMPPRVKNPVWSDNALDRFILDRLEEQGLQPAPAADRRTLLRRVTFDLIGLPPTPEEIDAFVNDPSPAAFARVVDRLLASPHYGERWGRHWLDVARYADSNGMDENLVQAQAWRYRDYVIASFNQDKPFPRFAQEQIAGDLVDTVTPETLVATGFLALGPKMLAEDDPVKMRMDIVDEQLDTLGKAFLGLTLGCARCHDHKFDPITTVDYYALAGIFHSTRVMENYKVVARWYERPVGSPDDVARQKEQEKGIDTLKAEIAAAVKEANATLLAEARQQTPAYVRAARAWNQHQGALSGLKSLAESKPGIEGTVVLEAENYTRGNVKKEFTGYGEGIGVIYNAGPLPNLAEYEVTLAKAGTYQIELRFAAAEARPVELAINDVVASPSAASTVTGSWYPDTQTWSVEGIFTLRQGKNTLRLKREGPFPHIDKLALVPRALPADIETGAALSIEQLARERRLNPIFLQQWATYLTKNPVPVGEALTRIVDDPAGPFSVSDALDRFYPAARQAELRNRRDALAAAEKAQLTLPEAMGATEGTLGDICVHRRGSHLTLGPEVSRGVPEVLAHVRSSPIGADQSGRRQLAEWLTHPDHPLTARVLVNRVWHWHFGAGLVRSTDNFGIPGDRPSHPELLDWLARRFLEDGGSIKALHRRILLSSTYQMSTAWNERAAQVDPENRLLWRFRRQRLDAESLRDGLLAVSGSLDRGMGGSLLQGANRGYVPGYPNSVYDNYDFPRRSVYLPVLRSLLYEPFQAFDFADPSTSTGERATTTVAPQALFAMNSKLMQEQARAWARRLLHEPPSEDRARLTRAYEQAFGRPPSESEITRLLDYLALTEKDWAGRGMAPDEGRLRAWESLCRVLLSSNEFVYVE